MIIVYGSIISPFVRKVISLLEIKNLAYQLEQLTPAHDREQIFSMNPLGKIPILKDESFVIPDSSVICAYLEKKFPQPSLYPQEPSDYARSLWYEEYGDDHFFPAMRAVFFNELLGPVLNQPTNPQALEEALKHKLPEIYTYLNREIADKNYLVNNRLSIADLTIFAPFLNLQLLNHHVDEKLWPNLTRYIKHLSLEPKLAAINQAAKERFKVRFGDKILEKTSK